MGWTYGGDPSKSSLDAVRFLIQDTNTNKQLIQDEEVEFAIAQEANIYCAAASICETLVMRAGGVRMKKIDTLTIQYDPVFYNMRAGQLRARGAGHQLPYAGGISVGDKTAQQTDTDAVAPSILRNINDNPGAPRPGVPPVNPLETI